MSTDLDDTVQIPPVFPSPAPPKARLRWLFAGIIAAGLTGAGGWAAWRAVRPIASTATPHATASNPLAAAASTTPNPPASVAPDSVTPDSVAPAAFETAPALPPLATEAAILASHSDVLQAYRFQPQPEVIVLQFASLADQADALNRVAALVERAGYPHDHVLDRAELDRRIRAGGSTPATFYYGHDYRTADILRFFAAVDRSGTPLSDGEADLRRRVAAWGWRPGVNGAVISLVQEDRAAGIDTPVRATILRHELSHGLYFVSPAYAEYSRQFWDTTLTDADRGHFRSFLAREGYDITLDDLVVNESQAYLMHTASKQFFNAEAIGIPEARLDLLRGLFLTGMPPGWLRDCTSLPIQAPPASAP